MIRSSSSSSRRSRSCRTLEAACSTRDCRLRRSSREVGEGGSSFPWSCARAPRTQIERGIRIQVHPKLTCLCCGISAGYRQKPQNVSVIIGNTQVFVHSPPTAASSRTPPSSPSSSSTACSSQIYAILSALPKHCSNFFRWLSFVFCFNHPAEHSSSCSCSWCCCSCCRFCCSFFDELMTGSA